ncbi:MAG: DUF3365 domain-containing protein [Desulfobulbaceae bacterium]|nr:DUF3365 domain-containing protein [Desulfobulbaceae bacterium]
MNISKLLSFLTHPTRSVRFFLYIVITLFMGFLNGLIDLIIHPGTAFFCREHFIIGGIMVLLTIMLCFLFEGHIKEPRTNLPPVKNGFYAWFFAIFWSIVIVCSLTWNIERQKQENIQVATSEARTIFNKDLVYYHWATDHKGVYVPITEKTPPNPYLTHLPESTGTTATGVPLTLVNPEYMIRQVYEIKTGKNSALGHITSLDPIREENAADDWECRALHAFEQGKMEVSSVEEIDGQPYLLLMRPMITEAGCLKCHEGYDLGDIRGGITVSVPMGLLFSIYHKNIILFSLAHGTLWIFGLLGIFLGSYRINQSMQKREEAEARTRSIIDNMLDGLVTISEYGIVESLNTAACKMFGYKPEEIIRKNIETLIQFPNSSGSSDSSEETQYHDIIGAVGSQKELTGLRSDRSTFPLEVSLSKMQHGRDRLLIATVRDITEEKIRKTEALRAGQLAAIGELAAGVAHEINNPINGIINYTQILLDDMDPKETNAELHEDIMGRIIKEGERIAVIVRNLLAFARQRDETLEEVRIEEVIEDSVALLNHQFHQDGIHLVMDIPKDLPFLRGNPQQLQQVIINLLTNASYALNQRYPGQNPEKKKLEIKSSCVTTEGKDILRTTITDWGSGIEQDVIDHIFDTLFTTKPPGKGTGLGLSISKGIVRDHRGVLSLKSKSGGPTIATLDLPVGGSCKEEA